MKLVIATPLYPPEPGGPATYAKLLEEHLPSRGIDVVLVKFGDVRHLPRFVRHFAYYRKVRAALSEADAVIALDPVSVGLPAARAAKKLKKPLFVKIVGDYAWEQGVQRFGVKETLDEFVKRTDVPFPVRVLRDIQREVADAAQSVIVPSTYLKTIVSTWGVPSEKIRVIYNAVEVTELGVVPESVSALSRPLVVSAGRLMPWKRMDTVIEAVQKIGASLAIVGDGPEKIRLEALAPTAVFTGALSHEDTLAVVKHADVFALASSYEGLSHLLIEARLLGTPTVATKAGGNAEVVEEGNLVPVGDADALAAALTRALTSGRPDTEGLKERFSVRGMIDSVAALIQP